MGTRTTSIPPLGRGHLRLADAGIFVAILAAFGLVRAWTSASFADIYVADNGALWGLSALELRGGNPSLLHPFYPWTGALLSPLTGEIASAMLLSSGIGGAVGLGLLYVGAIRAGISRGIALGGALALLASADWVFQSCFGQPEVWMGTLLLGQMLLLLDQAVKPTFLRIPLLAFLVSLATLTREHGIPLLGLTTLVLLWRAPRPFGRWVGIGLLLIILQAVGGWGGEPEIGPFFRQAWHLKPMDLSFITERLPSSLTSFIPQLSHQAPIERAPDFLSSPREGYASTGPEREAAFLNAFRSEWLYHRPLSPLTSVKWNLVHHAIIQWDLYPLGLLSLAGVGLLFRRGMRVQGAVLGAALAQVLPTALVWSDRRHIVPFLPIILFGCCVVVDSICQSMKLNQRTAWMRYPISIGLAATFCFHQAAIRDYANQWATAQAEKNLPLREIGRKVRQVAHTPDMRIAPFSASQARMQPGMVALYAEVPLGWEPFQPTIWQYLPPAEAWRTVVIDLQALSFPPPWEKVAETEAATAWMLAPDKEDLRKEHMGRLPPSPPYWLPRATDPTRPSAPPPPPVAGNQSGR